MKPSMNVFTYFDTMARARKGYDRLLEPVCRQWNLTRNELDVLLFLANNPEFDRAADIVHNRGLSKSHVSLSITNLEQRGLLLREKDPEDRRTIRLKLTEASREITDSGRMAQKRFFSHMHLGITQIQFDQMEEFVQTVRENINNMEDII